MIGNKLFELWSVCSLTGFLTSRLLLQVQFNNFKQHLSRLKPQASRQTLSNTTVASALYARHLPSVGACGHCLHHQTHAFLRILQLDETYKHQAHQANTFGVTQGLEIAKVVVRRNAVSLFSGSDYIRRTIPYSMTHIGISDCPYSHLGQLPWTWRRQLLGISTSARARSTTLRETRLSTTTMALNPIDSLQVGSLFSMPSIPLKLVDQRSHLP